MKKMSMSEMQTVNGGSAVALLGAWAGVCALFGWAMSKLGDWGLKSVKRK